MTERLLTADVVSPVWEFALRVRVALAKEFAGPVDVEHWRHATASTLRANAERAAEPRLTPDGVTVARPRPTAEVEGRSRASSGSSGGSPATSSASGPTGC